MKKRKSKLVSIPIEIKKLSVHYTEPYLINPSHPVTINLIGCGGTGSQVLSSLARMSSALKALGHTGLFVRAIDPDRVTEANMGRQLFSPSDVGLFKSAVLVGRINRYFGYDWLSEPCYYGQDDGRIPYANITISCVDSGSSRKAISDQLAKANDPIQIKRKKDWFNYHSGLEPYEVPYYWMDFGNMMDRGQVVIGTLRAIKQPAKSDYRCIANLPPINKYYRDIFIDNKNDDQGPSCSLAEALGKQDLFINTNLANMGLAILWKMFRELHVRYHGCYVNLETFSVNPIRI